MLEESINLDDLEDICEEATMAEPFIEDSAIIRCGRILRDKAKANAPVFALGSGASSVAVVVDDLIAGQREYIDLISTGTPSVMACQLLNLDVFIPTLWQETSDKDGTYMQCMQLLKNKQADLLEEEVWNQAMNGKNTTILKMFALKSRKDEYKDNAAPQTNLQTNIHVTVGGVPYDTSIATRQVEVENNG